MIYKLMGAIFIISGTSVYGFVRAMKPYRRYKMLTKIDTALSLMINEISFTNSCIDDIFRHISESAGVDGIFKTTAQMSKDISLCERWLRSIKTDSDRLYLKKEDCEALSVLGSELGMTDRKGQIKNIEHTRIGIRTLINEAHEEYLRESKMMKGLGILSGLFFVILLL